MLRLSRDVHCDLADIKVEAFKTLQRYGWLPMLPARLRPAKPFAPIETLVLAIYNTLCEQHRIHRIYAANICSGADILETRWSELRETVQERLDAGKEEIMFGRVAYPGTLNQGGGPKPVLGTLKEIAAEHPGAMSIVTVSVTRVGNVISNRARNHEIDLDQFWAEPNQFREGKARRRKKGAPR